ncbi:hypothetical protein [Clostridium sp. FP1]|uniref:hypothetical protein n=1 Tax=Clostridium sp. FP1 TaxID=2724076 RepID=UPI001CCDB6E1|nr:hypothetical protein [Clostridium sp. FP1]MBZ9636313.1 hypothetical protein [Clostridium sp. FP1]
MFKACPENNYKERIKIAITLFFSSFVKTPFLASMEAFFAAASLLNAPTSPRTFLANKI